MNMKQESYKLFRVKTFWLGIFALLVLILYSVIVNPQPSQFLIAAGFGSNQWVIIIAIVVSSSFMSMEYDNNTMNTLIYKSRSKLDVYLAKLSVVLGYNILLVGVGSLVSVVLKQVLVGQNYQWTSAYKSHRLIEAFLLNDVGTIAYLLFIISLSFLLIFWVKVNAAVIGVGLVVVFMGASFSSLIVQIAPGMATVLAWNPLNMINVINQLSDPGVRGVSYLGNSQLVVGNLVYALIFVWTGYLLFKRRYD